MKKPDWLKVRAPGGGRYHELRQMLAQLKLATVCQEAKCPNIGECWSEGTATIMIMGDTCTRGCRFCHVKTGHPQGKLDPNEPEKVAFAIGQMGEALQYIVITSVDRDDLPDQGSWHFARTVRAIRQQHPTIFIEILTPDFRGDLEAVEVVAASRPDVFAHNVETVRRLQGRVRDPRASYEQSLKVLQYVKENHPSIVTKTSLMVGLGESIEELKEALQDLRSIGCDAVTFGQYLQPTSHHLKVEKFYTPEEFRELRKMAEEMGFLYVASGPLVRSSYRAGEFYLAALVERQKLKKQRSRGSIELREDSEDLC